TPGAGSTLIFPHRLGSALSREILFTAREFHGQELKRRGFEMPVVPRSEVFGYALDLATHLASSSREDLVEQKNRRSQFLRDRLHTVFARELAMHDKTFVGNDEVVANIARYFNDGGNHSEPVPEASGNTPPHEPVGDPHSLQQVLETLRGSLAEE